MFPLKKLPASLLSLLILATACQTENKPQDNTSALQGTWELVSETKIEGQDTTYSEAAKNQRMIKIINETHFAFLRHDLNQGKDSLASLFVAGGGPYTLKDGEYTERLEYCSARGWENNTFNFTVGIQNDTLIQQGREKVEGLNVDRIIIEKYRRVKE